MTGRETGGFSLDKVREREIERGLRELIDLVEIDVQDHGAIIEASTVLIDLTIQLRRLSSRDTGDLADGTCEVDEKPVIPLVRNTDVSDVFACWRRQQVMNAREALGILEGSQEVLAQLVRSRLDDAVAGPTAFLEALGEIRKVSLLRSREADPVAVKEGATLFSDDMREGHASWIPCGEYELTTTSNGLRYENSATAFRDAMLWTDDVFSGDHAVRLTMTAHSDGGGVILAICGSPGPGKDLSASVGEGMEPYNHGIDAYHTSVHRVGTDMTNLRRPGRGLKMLASVSPDPCVETDRPYELHLYRWGRSVAFTVDGRLIHHYYDGGVYGPVLREGRIGIRQWRGTDVTYRDVTVSSLVGEVAG